MKNRFQLLTVAFAMIGALPLQSFSCWGHEPDAVLAGWAETVSFGKLKLTLKAKLDTGARTSSLHAQDIQMFQRDGTDWVRFAVPGKTGSKRVFERPLHRMSAVRRAGTALEKRPVVLLSACVAGIDRVAEFNLKNRSGMRFPVLIGRTFLRDDILVSSSARNLHHGQCPAR